MAVLNEDVLFVVEFVDDDGAAYDPSPAPTVAVVRYNADDGSGETLVTGQASVDTGVTGRLAYLLDSADNDALGVLEATFTTTDTGIDPLLRTASASVDVEASASVDLSPVLTAIAGIPAAVWAYATASAGAVSTFGGKLLDALNTLLTRTSAGVTVVAPVNAMTGNLEVIRGDDYTLTSGRPLPTWSSADWTPYDLSTATAIQFRAQPATGGTVFTKAVTALSDTEVRLELTDTETAAFAVGKNAFVFDIQATLLTGDIVTLVRGYMSVVRDVR